MSNKDKTEITNEKPKLEIDSVDENNRKIVLPIYAPPKPMA